MVLAVGNKLEPFLKGAYDLAAGIATELAKVGQKAKQETVENIGLKRAESEIAKALIKYGGDYTVKNAQFLRQQEAIVLLMGMEERISKQSTIAINAKIAAAGSFNTRAKVTQERAERELAILRQEEEALTKIAGLEIDSGKKKKELTDEELKALKARYDAKLKLLEIEKRIADINIEVTTPREDERTLKLLRNAEKFGKDKLAIDREFAALGIVDAQNNAKLQTAIVKQQENDITVEIKKQQEIREDSRIKWEKKVADDREKQLKIIKDANWAEIEYDKDKIKKQEKIREDADESRIKWEKKLADEKAAIIEASIDLAAETTNSLFNLQSQYAARDMERKQKQFDEEIRLADGNVQKINEINERRAAAEKEYRIKEFRANQLQAVANVVFNTAPIIAQYAAKVITAPLAIIAAAAAAAQIIAIYAQPLPEFAEGTKGKPFKGRAIVGEKGTEKVVTQSGKVYYTPGVATLAQFDEPVQIIPNNQLGLNDRKQLSLIYGSTSRTNDSGGRIIEKLSNIESGLKNMPVAAISLDERGFMKKVRTPNRSTTILNNRFKN